eukprot:GHVS01067689.1.p3 GENE.GHVS01067689.1~~GHVS01067689.1.p3  ORF type:complete len:147 (+),score=20.91 GHVS01067689.1:1309-1749(+)
MIEVKQEAERLPPLEVGCSSVRSVELTTSTVASPFNEWEDMTGLEEGVSPMCVDMPFKSPDSPSCIERPVAPLAPCCLICLCEYEHNELLRILPCGHGFHAQCVDVWLATRAVCPLRCDIIQLLCMREQQGNHAEHNSASQDSEVV